MRKLYVYAGIAASVIMIVIGAGAIAVGASGRADVRDKIQDEKIVGTPDMSGEPVSNPERNGFLVLTLRLPWRSET